MDRSQPDLFRALQEHFAGDPDVQVIWDRRTAEVPTTSVPATGERLRTERRTAPPATWTALGVLLAHGGRAYEAEPPP